jgi:hypothetical protein
VWGTLYAGVRGDAHGYGAGGSRFQQSDITVLAAHGGAVRVESSPADPQLESAWFQPLMRASEVSELL